MTKRIGILTGGGDCPGLNAVLRAVVNHAHGQLGWTVVGIEDGFQGMFEQRTVELDCKRVSDLIARGGTILGSSNRANPFAYPMAQPDGGERIIDASHQCLSNLERLGLDALIVVGGDGTLAIAHQLMGRGVGLVGVPKTIDNDLAATDATIGYQTAVEVATEALDRLHTTAESHDRIIICEVMGRYAGWIAMAAGMSSGADVILIPEIEYDIAKVVDSLHRGHAAGRSFSVIVVAEGARPRGGDYAVAETGEVGHLDRLGGAGQRLAGEIAALSRYDLRVTVLGHLIRGGTPCAFDRLLATRFGVRAVELIAAGQLGRVAAIHGGEIVDVSIEEAVSRPKRVDPAGDLVRAARAVGVELGGA
jgi:phosphofructokinase-like protein